MKNGILKDLSDKYLQGIADDIANAKSISSIFPNMSDVGDVRENVLLKFLQLHLPSRCSVIKGGFVFDSTENVSNQIELLVVNDFSLKFSYFDQHAQNSKNIQTVEGCLTAISIKSTLDKEKLYDALNNLASIPKMPEDILDKINPLLGDSRNHYLNLPLKIVFAFSGQTVEKTLEHVNNFYRDNKLNDYQKSSLIIVNDSFCLQRVYKGGGTTRDGTQIAEGTFHPMYSDKKEKFGALPLLWLLMKIQETAQFSPHILFNYQKYFDAIDFH
jgi:hypothetical protein